MESDITKNKNLKFWKLPLHKILLGFTILYFIIFGVFMAYTNGQPDQTPHNYYSSLFSETWGVPEEEMDVGNYLVTGRPYLYYWLNGAIAKVYKAIFPVNPPIRRPVVWRLFSVILSTFTVYYTYKLAHKVTNNPFAGVLAAFFLANTLMFVFLAAGVNYDNLANLLCMIGLYFFVRVYREHNFITNSLAWMIFIGLAALVKYTILPLALAISIAWLIYVVLHRKSLFPINLSGARKIILTIIFLAIVLFNFSIYGMNLIEYQNILPPCQEILLESQCSISPFEKRYQEIAIKPKMTFQKSIEEGYPGPIAYAFDTWVENMLLRTFGMIGHKSYFPLELLMYFKILFYGTGILGLIFFRPKSFLKFSLVGIVLFYALVLLITNYNSELTYGFIHIALQGRYIFPVIGLIYVLFALIGKEIPFRELRWILLLYTLGLFLVGGPLTIILKYHSLFFSWFS